MKNNKKLIITIEKLYFQCSGYSLSGLDICNDDVTISNPHVEHKPIQTTVSRKVSAHFKVWNGEGSPKTALPSPPKHF